MTWSLPTAVRTRTAVRGKRAIVLVWTGRPRYSTAGSHRTGAAFEERLRPFQTRTIARFPRAAVLVRTAVGKLQVTRASRSVGHDGQAIFHDEGEAVAHLTAKRAR